MPVGWECSTAPAGPPDLRKSDGRPEEAERGAAPGARAEAPRQGSQPTADEGRAARRAQGRRCGSRRRGCATRPSRWCRHARKRHPGRRLSPGSQGTGARGAHSLRAGGGVLAAPEAARAQARPGASRGRSSGPGPGAQGAGAVPGRARARPGGGGASPPPPAVPGGAGRTGLSAADRASRPAVTPAGVVTPPAAGRGKASTGKTSATAAGRTEAPKEDRSAAGVTGRTASSARETTAPPEARREPSPRTRASTPSGGPAAPREPVAEGPGTSVGGRTTPAAGPRGAGPSSGEAAAPRARAARSPTTSADAGRRTGPPAQQLPPPRERRGEPPVVVGQARASTAGRTARPVAHSAGTERTAATAGRRLGAPEAAHPPRPGTASPGPTPPNGAPAPVGDVPAPERPVEEGFFEAPTTPRRPRRAPSTAERFEPEPFASPRRSARTLRCSWCATPPRSSSSGTFAASSSVGRRSAFATRGCCFASTAVRIWIGALELPLGARSTYVTGLTSGQEYTAEVLLLGRDGWTRPVGFRSAVRRLPPGRVSAQLEVRTLRLPWSEPLSGERVPSTASSPRHEPLDSPRRVPLPTSPGARGPAGGSDLSGGPGPRSGRN